MVKLALVENVSRGGWRYHEVSHVIRCRHYTASIALRRQAAQAQAQAGAYNPFAQAEVRKLVALMGSFGAVNAVTIPGVMKLVQLWI